MQRRSLEMVELHPDVGHPFPASKLGVDVVVDDGREERVVVDGLSAYRCEHAAAKS